MYIPKDKIKDEIYARAFLKVLSRYQTDHLNIVSGVIQYKKMVQQQHIKVEDKFMSQVAHQFNKNQNNYHMTNIGAAQYFYKVFHKHEKNSKPQHQTITKTELLDQLACIMFQ